MGASSQGKLNWKREVIESILIYLLGAAMTFAFDWNLFNRPIKNILFSMSYSGFMWLFFWKGNSYLVDYWNKRISWLEEPGRRFRVGVISVIVYTPLILYVINFVYNLFPNIQVPYTSQQVLISIGITFFITFFMFAMNFLDNWRKASLLAERMKREQMATKYESLKNQVNPHFLFNSLNALTNLVYEDQDQAADFIRQLSKVYRYVLDTRSQEVVTIEQEMKFIESYMFLQKIRFDDKLNLEVNVNGHDKSMVPPIAIQMLLENAIKHNTIAEEEPLTITIDVEDDQYLVIRNNLQKKNIPSEPSSGMGLSNIKARYEFLSETPVEIIENENDFIVKLPLLELSA